MSLFQRVKQRPPQLKTAQPNSPKTLWHSAVNFVIVIAIAVLLAILVQAYIIKTFVVPTGSMIPTLAIGQRVIVDRVSLHFTNPSIGWIVVFRPPTGGVQVPPVCGKPQQPGAACDASVGPRYTKEYFIKRVVAGPGDRLKIINGHVIRNGHREPDSYIRACTTTPPPYGSNGCNFPTEITIPPGHWYMMGDNRGESSDSRYWGPIPKDWMIGEAIFTYWPPDRIGFF
jgi:signal peptidase I